jgi:hypothetical protein
MRAPPLEPRMSDPIWRLTLHEMGSADFENKSYYVKNYQTVLIGNLIAKISANGGKRMGRLWAETKKADILMWRVL